MKQQTNPIESARWLEQAYPQLHFLLLALEGDRPAILWLEANSPGTALLVRLLDGDDTARAKMNNGGQALLDDLFEMVDNDDVAGHLRGRSPNLYLLFSAVRGDEQAARKLKKAEPAYHRHLGELREVHDRFANHDGPEPFEGSTAADMGCLVGEMHLKQGEWEKAIEAFTRAIETQPSADLYEGRARAYRGLAEQDLERATLIRQGR